LQVAPAHLLTISVAGHIHLLCGHCGVYRVLGGAFFSSSRNPRRSLDRIRNFDFESLLDDFWIEVELLRGWKFAFHKMKGLQKIAALKAAALDNWA
jgi:hypothetical protein